VLARKRVVIEGSEPAEHDRAAKLGDLHPARSIRVTLHLRHRSRKKLPSLVELSRDSRSRRWRREEFASEFGAHPSDVARVKRFASDHDLDFVELDRARRTVVLSGTARAMSLAFDVELDAYESGEGRHHAQRGPIFLDSALAPLVHGVFGLDTRPQTRSHLRYLTKRAKGSGRAAPRYTPPEVASLYDFPDFLDGRHQTVALLQLGGGFRRRDVVEYFRRLKIPQPRISVVRVGKARNRPTGRPESADAEVLMDLQIAASVAPGARFVVYFTSNDDRGFIDGVKHIIHDRVHRPDVLSISWGASESEWSKQALRVVHQAFHDAGHLGLTICASSGDLGASDGLTDGLAVEFPASSPHALACGGTRLESRGGAVESEAVWNGWFDEKRWASGGGVSDVFPLPKFQRAAGVPRRKGGNRGAGVPDVAANADPETGYLVRVDGRWMHLGGTSAAAPLWAGLVARLNQGLKMPAGFLQPTLYRLRRDGALSSVTRGTNGFYSARPGWDPCTGLGSPSGMRLLEALRRCQER
jgi:kumamolisin